MLEIVYISNYNKKRFVCPRPFTPRLAIVEQSQLQVKLWQLQITVVRIPV